MASRADPNRAWKSFVACAGAEASSESSPMIARTVSFRIVRNVRASQAFVSSQTRVAYSSGRVPCAGNGKESDLAPSGRFLSRDACAESRSRHPGGGRDRVAAVSKISTSRIVASIFDFVRVRARKPAALLSSAQKSKVSLFKASDR